MHPGTTYRRMSFADMQIIPNKIDVLRPIMAHPVLLVSSDFFQASHSVKSHAVNNFCETFQRYSSDFPAKITSLELGVHEAVPREDDKNVSKSQVYNHSRALRARANAAIK